MTGRKVRLQRYGPSVPQAAGIGSWAGLKLYGITFLRHQNLDVRAGPGTLSPGA